MKKVLTLILIVGMVVIWKHAATAAGSESVLPPIEEDEARLSSVGRVFVRKFRLEGNTVFSEEDLAPILGPYENREITAEEMQEAKKSVTLFYIDRGYVNSGAVIPDQQMKDGIITFRIIEGKLSKTEVSGNTWLRTGYISKRLELTTGPEAGPLNIITLQDRLKLIRQDPRVENINATLGPGLEPGEAMLDVKVDESRPYHMSLTFNNHNSPGIGSYRGEVGLRHINLTGWGDALGVSYGLTEGLNEYSANYTIPITRWDTTLAFDFDRSESDVVTDPFDKLDIASKTKTYSVALRHPFYKTLSREFAMELKFEKRESETYLLNEPFSFAEGTEDGESEISVLRFSQEWVDRTLTQVLALRSSFGFGLDMMGATVNDSGVDGEFITWLGQFQWLKRISPLNSQILLRTDLRLSNDPLLPMEKFSIGGATTVRGYRENQLTTDNGVISAFEWRIPVAQLRVTKGTNDGFLHLVLPFFDFGQGWNTDRPDPSTDSIYSTGVGLRWTVTPKILAEVYWGYALRDVEDPGEYNIQDDGIHFQITAELF
ncbi:ShlB/FhaC/HecB family hemolysin secretion/activation protein [Desulfobacterales bacterium HSG2]|nr:ShlB/FhaC/HecB family hemolysin secretion/activation protein [Desulfobacterales bacterium HSG2]